MRKFCKLMTSPPELPSVRSRRGPEVLSVVAEDACGAGDDGISAEGIGLELSCGGVALVVSIPPPYETG